MTNEERALLLASRAGFLSKKRKPLKSKAPGTHDSLASEIRAGIEAITPKNPRFG
jgi:hypothetical protein